MKLLDRLLRDARIRRARPYVRRGDTVLDVGCADGEMFRRWRGFIGHGVGIDPTLTGKVVTDSYELLPGGFPDAVPPGATFDVITMLAVVEHLPRPVLAALADACDALLEPRGRIVITVPSPRVDDILHVLDRLRLIDGMSIHEHHGFRPSDTPAIFPRPRYRLVTRRRFQLGLNNLFVFARDGG
jgi:SAM-dependent methyltransferase